MSAYFKKIFLIFIWLHWVFVAACGLSLVVGSGGCSLGVVCRLLIAVASLGAEHRLQHWAQQLWCLCLVALGQVKSSQARDGTHVPCIGSQILNHWEVRWVHIWNTVAANHIYLLQVGEEISILYAHILPHFFPPQKAPNGVWWGWR